MDPEFADKAMGIIMTSESRIDSDLSDQVKGNEIQSRIMPEFRVDPDSSDQAKEIKMQPGITSRPRIVSNSSAQAKGIASAEHLEANQG